MSNFPDLSHQGFQVVRELGQNRAGGRVTYLALYGNRRLPVAIKQFQFAQQNSTWSDYEAIQREIQVLRGLNHPSIPRYLGSFQTPTGFCLVQEYKNAPSLANPRSFDPDEIKQIAAALLEILVYLQNRIPPISHRDVKPENILVDDNLNVFLVDFGLARIGNSEVAMSSVAKGTIGFMAPEQLFNRQLSEASDLYGLGTTLICLLTGIPSTQISHLIDDDYRINFKHLVPRLSLRWIDWLQKMVELKPKDRFPDAETALAALQPIYVIRTPEVKLSHTHIELTAKKLGEKVTEIITLENSVPDTVLESHWQVAPHLSDPPHTPDSHKWIQLYPSHLVGNHVQCRIIVDTSKLVAARTFERTILVQANSQPETHAVQVKVKTAPLPVAPKKLPYTSLGLLVLFAAVAAWVETTAWEGIINQSGTTGVTVAIFISAFVAVLGLVAAVTSGLIAKVAAKLREKFGVTVRAMDTVAAVFFAGVAAMGVARFGAQFRTADAAIAAFAAVDAVVFMAAFEGEGVAQSCRQRGFSKTLAFGVSLLSAALGISLGMGLKLGFANHPSILLALLGTGFPLGTLIAYLPLEQAKRIANYRKREVHLIEP
jgi:serine/threonine protein kinase